MLLFCSGEILHTVIEATRITSFVQYSYIAPGFALVYEHSVYTRCD